MARPWTAIVKNRRTQLHEKKSFSGSFDMSAAVTEFGNKNKDLELIALIPGDVRELALCNEKVKRSPGLDQLFSGF